MPVDFARLTGYLDSLVPTRHPELRKMEEYATQHDFPILGPASSQFCHLITRLVGARQVFEMGSGYGYSTAWFARAVEDNGGGVVHHTVWDEQLSAMAREHLGKLGFPPLGSGARTEIAYTVGEAVEALSKESGPFDVIFNDIDKEGYPKTIEVVRPRLRKGGLFITDNVVWSGRVLEEEGQDASTKAIQEFTRLLAESDDWETTIVPIRDGLLVAVAR